MKTFKKTLASVGLVSMLAMNVAMAAQIGTGTITGVNTSSIDFSGTFPGTATGVLTPVIVTASVDPVLNMTVSTGGLALGTLDTVGKSANLGMELGTNATNGIVVTASSANGGLTSNTASGIINSELTDGVQESYTFASSTGVVDSSVADFTSSVTTATEVTTGAKDVVIYTSNRPEKTDLTNNDVTFTVAAKSAEQTAAASDYSDTITFTVVGSF
ncbi:MAG: hypothetical protein PHG82_05110 [Candidatus Gracilibacteria bacterium]|nr:hypothetical protein [Candidatus Gracilibacteria bacterium]